VRPARATEAAAVPSSSTNLPPPADHLAFVVGGLDQRFGQMADEIRELLLAAITEADDAVP
jgi:hypothetical protein